MKVEVYKLAHECMIFTGNVFFTELKIFNCVHLDKGSDETLIPQNFAAEKGTWYHKIL